MHSDSFEGPVALKMLRVGEAPLIDDDWENQGVVLGLLLRSDRLVQAKGFVTIISNGNLEFHKIEPNFSLEDLEQLMGHRLVAIAYDYLKDAKDLEQLIRDGNISPEIAPAIGLQIVEGLEHLHGARILYCDLKPSNILVTPEGVKLIDWNTLVFPKRFDQKTTKFAGTTAYLAPESLMSEISKESDLYSLGITLYEMNYGPFEEPDLFLKLSRPNKWNKKLCESLQDKVVALDPTQKKHLDDLLGRLLHPNPAKSLPLALVKTHPYFTGGDLKGWRRSVNEWREHKNNLRAQSETVRHVDLSAPRTRRGFRGCFRTEA